MATTLPQLFETMEYGPAPESDKPALAWLEQHGASFGHFINGGWTAPKRAAQFDVINPATTKVLARVTQGSKQDVDAAVKAARKALPAWQKLSGHARARHLYALARTVQRHSRLLATKNGGDLTVEISTDGRPTFLLSLVPNRTGRLQASSGTS